MAIFRSPLLCPARRGPECVEWMDAGSATDAEIAEAYRQLEQVNRRLGGYRATFQAVEELRPGWATADPALLAVDSLPAAAHRRELSILDVAGGDGLFAARLVERLAAPGRPVTAWVLDFGRVPTAIAAERPAPQGRIVAVRGDARRLPFPDRSVDLVHTAAFLHHLGVGDACDVLAEMCRVSRRVVVANDLVRSRVAAGSIWLLARLLSGNRLIRHDGPLSVLKAFTPAELIRMVRASGPHAAAFRWRLDRTFPYRMTLVGARVSASPPPRALGRFRGPPKRARPPKGPRSPSLDSRSG